MILSLILLFISFVYASSEFQSIPSLYKHDQIEIIGRFLPSSFLPSNISSSFLLNNGEDSWISSWSGSGYRFRFQSFSTNNSFSFQFSPCYYYDTSLNDYVSNDSCSYDISISVNCNKEESIQRYTISNKNNIINFIFPDELLDKEYNINEIEIFRENETKYSTIHGLFNIKSIGYNNNKIKLLKKYQGETKNLLCSYPRKMHALYIGDSITCGYGVYCINSSEHFSQDTESVSSSYSKLTSDSLYASSTFISWSGRGVFKNYGDSNEPPFNPTMPVMFNRTIADLDLNVYPNNYYPSPLDIEKLKDISSPSTSFSDSRYLLPPYNPIVPDYFFFTLGTNDYALPPYPEDNDFINTYVNFANYVLINYIPSLSNKYQNNNKEYIKKIIFSCAPMRNDNLCKNIKIVSEKIQENYQKYKILSIKYFEFDNSTISFNGCDSHPSAEDQKEMSKQILNFLNNNNY